MDSNHTSIINWPYKFFLYFWDHSMCLLDQIFKNACNLFAGYSRGLLKPQKCFMFPCTSGREIAPNTGTNMTKFFTLATKSWKLVAKLATRTFHHNLTKRYSELKRFAKINPWQTSSLSLFLKHSTCFSIDN